MIEVAGLAAGDDVDLADLLAEGDGFFAPLAAGEVVGARVEEVHGDQREKRGSAALEEEHIVRIAEAEQLLAARDRLIVNGFEFLAAMADLGDAEAFALIIQKRGGGFL